MGKQNGTLCCSCSKSPNLRGRTTFFDEPNHNNRKMGGHMNQQQLLILIVVIIIVAAVGLAAILVLRKRRSKVLREQFGPEYDRVVKREGDVRRGEEVLGFRTERRKKLEIVPLSTSSRSDFASRWTSVQSQFVDDPKGAVSQANELLDQVMLARGYPVGDFDQRAADVSVDHPLVVDNYRAAHEIALRHSRGEASTEDLRRAMVYYRSLFDQLLENSIPARKEA
jgi:hypothetical protein